MRLNVTSTSNVHKELVACVGWNAFNELYSVGDDKTVSRWDINGDAGGKVRKHDPVAMKSSLAPLQKKTRMATQMEFSHT